MPLVRFAEGFPFEDYGLVVTTSELPGAFDFTVVVEQTPSGPEITTSGF